MNDHASLLAGTHAVKAIEFQTYLDSNTGSRTLTVPHAIVRLCADLVLNVANQAIRLLTQSEYEALRGQRN